MKILTLNTHSLAEENATEKMQLFSGIIEQEQPEIMAFQEVNQTPDHLMESAMLRPCVLSVSM